MPSSTRRCSASPCHCSGARCGWVCAVCPALMQLQWATGHGGAPSNLAIALLCILHLAYHNRTALCSAPLDDRVPCQLQPRMHKLSAKPIQWTVLERLLCTGHAHLHINAPGSWADPRTIANCNCKPGTNAPTSAHTLKTPNALFDECTTAALCIIYWSCHHRARLLLSHVTEDALCNALSAHVASPALWCPAPFSSMWSAATR
jgi:hypothetical protein